MTTMVEGIVHRTERRSDAKGEFIIRLPCAAQAALGVNDRGYVVVTMKDGKLVPGGDHKRFHVLAAVRCLSGEDAQSLPGEEDAPGPVKRYHVRMDLALRQAIGAKIVEIDRALSTVEVKKAPRPHHSYWAKWLGYQYVICRVQKAYSGDAETHLCRTSESVIQTLGLTDQVVGVLLSSEHTVRVRVLPLPTTNYEVAERVIEGMKSEDMGSRMDFAYYLEGDNAARGWRMPDIHLDNDIRDMLGVVAGQAIWVRREPFSLLAEKFPLIVAPIVLAVFGAAISGKKWDELRTEWNLLILVGTAAVLFAFACWEIRNQVKRPKTLDDSHGMG